MPKMKKILVPTDFSENATSVYDFVRKAAQNHGAKVDLIHIIPEASDLEIYRDVSENPSGFLEDYRKIKNQLTAKLEAELENNFPEENRGEIFIHYKEKPANAISEHAAAGNYDLIIIASRGHGNSIFSRGSVTEKLIRISNIPVLSCNKGTPADIKSILYTTDGSQVSFEALSLALMIMEKTKAEFHLLGVVKFDAPMVKTIGSDARIQEYALNHLRTDILEGLKKYVAQTDNVEFVEEPTENHIVLRYNEGAELKINLKVTEGVSVYNSIIEYAQEKADLVVMTTHGRSGLAKLFIGSITEKVVRQLRMPVLTVTPDFAKK